MARRYGVLPTALIESDVENARIFEVATEVERKIAENSRNG